MTIFTTMLGNALLTKYHVARAILVQQYFHKALQENDKGTSSQQPIQSCTGKWYIMHTYHIPFAREDRVGQTLHTPKLKSNLGAGQRRCFMLRHRS